MTRVCLMDLFFPRSRELHPRKLAQIQMPIRTVCHTNGLGFLLVGYFIKIKVPLPNVISVSSQRDSEHTCKRFVGLTSIVFGNQGRISPMGGPAEDLS
jgi:hypothetical protein